VRFAVLFVVAAACGRTAPPTRPDLAGAEPGVVASNVLRADYAGSRGCADCHAELFDAWASSPMRNMTRDVSRADIRAPFGGETLRVGSDAVVMERDGDARVMRVVTPTGTHRFRITKVIGGRYREDFVGVELGGGDGLEHVLPATYVFSSASWRYKGYSVMVKERPRTSWRGVWAQDCIPCHNTLPLATMFYDELYGPKLPGYQGKLADRFLPSSRTWSVRARDPGGLAEMLASEIRLLGGEPPATGSLDVLLPAAATTMRQRLGERHLVELGIGCEACHNGAGEHAVTPERLPSFAPTSSLLEVVPPPGQTGTRAQWINRSCARCHTVLFSQYTWTWEGGTRRSRPGGSTTNSGEGRDFQLGACATAMSCTTCHDPHAEDAPGKLAALATPAGNAVCVTCHTAYATAEAVAQHTHHPSGSTGTACVACHMAKKNMGLDYALVRYHRIGSPTEPARVEGDRPLECALCHADHSVERIVTTMETWWGKRFDRRQLERLYGDDLSVNALRATLVRGKPHEQAVAIAVLGEQREKSAIKVLGKLLAHDYPLVRFYAQRALQTITGDPVAVDVGAPAAEVTQAAEAWLKAYVEAR
jgi:predicted CXXCH cytochrome family protein